MNEEYTGLGSFFAAYPEPLDPDTIAKLVSNHFEQGNSGPLTVSAVQAALMGTADDEEDNVVCHFSCNNMGPGSSWQLLGLNRQGQVQGTVALPPLPSGCSFYQVLHEDGECFFWAGGNETAVHCGDYYSSSTNAAGASADQQGQQALQGPAGVAAKSPPFPGMTQLQTGDTALLSLCVSN